MIKKLSAAVFALATLALAASSPAQINGPRGGAQFKDVSILKPAPGQKVEIIVFEDLECPACAYAHPIELRDAEKYRVPIVRYDFPLQMHLWSRDAAIFARYLQDKVSPKLADDYRTAVFAQQRSINSKDDLQNFTRKWMGQRGQNMPFVIDPNGQFAIEVMHDQHTGERLNVTRTPTIVVATPTHFQVVSGNEDGSSSVDQLASVLDAATREAGVTAATTPRSGARTGSAHR